MFGHHDDKQSQPANDEAPAEADQQATPPNDAGQDSQPAAAPAQDGDDAQTTEVVHPEPATPPAADADATAPAVPQEPAWQHPGTPLDSGKEQISDVISPAGGFPKRPTYQYPAGKPVLDSPDAPTENPADHDLIDVKKHALDELEPLLDKLDLPPEEKFRAVMMIVQANDDRDLIKAAYEAAHAIEDEEARARALYMVVNEVDYFTQPDNASN